MTAQNAWRTNARAALAIGFAGTLVWVASAQQQPGAPAAAGRGNFANNFTGEIKVLDSKDLRTSRIHFDAGSRTNWHVHAQAQVILAEKGRGRYQEKGGSIADFGEGQPIYLKAGLAHWHGATPETGIDQMSVYAGDLKWMEKVTDDEYLGRKK
jgi:4-carboxymuconolactone decarboxylase